MDKRFIESYNEMEMFVKQMIVMQDEIKKNEEANTSCFLQYSNGQDIQGFTDEERKQIEMFAMKLMKKRLNETRIRIKKLLSIIMEIM